MDIRMRQEWTEKWSVLKNPALPSLLQKWSFSPHFHILFLSFFQTLQWPPLSATTPLSLTPQPPSQLHHHLVPPPLPHPCLKSHKCVIYWSFGIANPRFFCGISAIFSAVFSTEYPEEESQNQDTELVFKQNNPTQELEVEHHRIF